MDYLLEIEKIASNIRRIRRAKGITAQELAYRCDMERSNISRIEAGRSNMTVRTLCLIGTALGVSLKELVE